MMVRAKLAVVLISALIVAYGFVGGVISTSAVGSDVYEVLSIFWDVFEKVRRDYVESPNMDRAVKGALQGMIESLDPYSSYIDSDSFRELSKRRGDGQAGTGMVLAKRFGYIYVVSVLPGSPAAKQGMRKEDLIESIEGQSTASMSLWEAESRLMGPEGSGVEVRVIRARRSEPVLVKLERGQVQRAAVSTKMLEPGVGLVKIPHFDRGVSEEVRSGLERLRSQELRGLLVDLRGTAQGEFAEAARVAGAFLPQESEVFTLKGREGKSRAVRSSGRPLTSGLALAVLVDSGTSGAAETLAAALQDHQSARIIGRRTNGQGAVQESFRLQDGSVLILSTQRAFRPSGAPIQGEGQRETGVKPDVRSPSQDFVTNFFYDNIPEGGTGEVGEEFYRKLDQAMDAEQLRTAIEMIRENLLNKKAA